MNIFVGKGERLSHEKKDCSVIAIATAFNLEYGKAHAICKKAGRKDNKGFYLATVFRLKNRKSCTFLGRRVSNRNRPGMSVEKFKLTHPLGTFILWVRGHVCTLIDGNLINQTNLKQHVLKYYKIGK